MKVVKTETLVTASNLEYSAGQIISRIKTLISWIICEHATGTIEHGKAKHFHLFFIFFISHGFCTASAVSFKFQRHKQCHKSKRL